MNTSSTTIVQRLWNYCNVLRDDGMSYGDYVEQLTYLLFLKMDHENSSMLGKATPSCLPQIRNRDLLCLPSFRFRIWGRCPAGRWGSALEGRL